MSRRLYFDHNASAPPAPGTAAAVARFWAEEWGNPSSVHSEGRRARAAVERARTEIAEAAGAGTAMFHTCHNVSPEELARGETYVTLMRGNLERLRAHLNER